MKNFKKISISVLMTTVMLFGSGSYAMQPVQVNQDQRLTTKEKYMDGLATAVIAPTVLGGAAYMFKKHMASMDTATLSKFFGARVLNFKTMAVVGLTASVIAGAAGLYGMKQSFASQENLGFGGRCKKFSKNAALVGVSALATAGCYKVLAISARNMITASVDFAYNVKACTPLVVTGMIATGALLGCCGLREVWEAYKGVGCKRLTLATLQERTKKAFDANRTYANF
jgi:hypothetical protein